MKNSLLFFFNITCAIGLSATLLTGCQSLKSHEKVAAEQAKKTGLEKVEKANFDGTFIAPGTDFSQYKKILVARLDLENPEIIQPSSRHQNNDVPWALNDADKRYYQTQYTEAFINNLVADGTYVTAMDAGADVILLKAKIIQIAPLASKDDLKSRPTMMKVYTEGAGTMTIEMSLYDSSTNKLLGIITDRRDLGRIWAENNRVTNNQQVRLAFHAWLRKLRSELELLSATGH